MLFVENPDALFLIRRHLQRKRFPFVYLDAEGRRSERIRQAARFGKRGGGAVCLLASTATPASGAASLISGVDNVVFFDVSLDSSSSNVGRWIKYAKIEAFSLQYQLCAGLAMTVDLVDQST